MYFPIILILNLVVVHVSSRTSAREREAEYFTNTWSTRILGGVEKARDVAKKQGFDFVEQVSRCR